MSDIESLNVEALLQPISANNPAGVIIQAGDGVKWEIDQEREFDEVRRRQNDPKMRPTDWNKVVEKCKTALTKESKDLQLAIWLCEGLTQINGFLGLADGFSFLSGLLDRYWDTMYPMEIEQRGKQLENGFARKQPDSRLLACVKELEKSIGTTPTKSYQQATKALQNLQRLLRNLELKFENDVPNLSNLLEELEKCGGDATAPPSATVSPSEKSTSGIEPRTGNIAPAQVSVLNELNDRQAAFEQLARIAKFLKRTEPYHPVTYLLERAVRWSTMPLEDWLVEVVQNQDALAHLRDTLGIKAKKEDA